VAVTTIIKSIPQIPGHPTGDPVPRIRTLEITCMAEKLNHSHQAGNHAFPASRIHGSLPNEKTGIHLVSRHHPVARFLIALQTGPTKLAPVRDPGIS
jgi:hypothetical protein